MAEAVAGGGFTLAERRRLAARAYAHTAGYDAAVASWFASVYAPDDTAAGDRLAGRASPRSGPGGRYCATGRTRTSAPRCTPRTAAAAGHRRRASQLHGKAMSYNNYVDAAAAWRAAFEFTEPCVAIIKHANPCGIASGADLAEAHRKANACDPVSAYGGVIAANGEVTAATGRPDRGHLHRGRGRARLRARRLRAAHGEEEPAAAGLPATRPRPAARTEWRQLDGGLLMQSADRLDAPGDDPASWELKAGPPASAARPWPTWPSPGAPAAA